MAQMQETALKSHIEKLWQRPQSHFFISDFSKLATHYSTKDLILELVSQTSKRCYEPQYKTTVPHCLMGLETAYQLFGFFNSSSRLLPLAQMSWYAVGEGQSSEVNIKEILGTPPVAEKLNMETLKEDYAKRNFNELFSLIVFLLRKPEDRKKVFSFLVSETLHDELNVGHKIIYLAKTWQFCESVGWKRYEVAWFAVLHYLITAEPHVETYPVVEVFYNQNWKKLLKAIQKNDVTFPADDYESFRDMLFNDERQATLNGVLSHIEKGQSLHSLFEVLKLSACDLMIQGNYDKWVTTVHALTYTECLSAISYLLEPQDQIKALLMSTLFIKKMAILSKPLSHPVINPLKTVDEKKRPEYFLEHAIKIGQLSDALGALDHLVTTGTITKPVLELLAFTASKNDYSVLYAHDLKYAWATLSSYQNSSHPLKAKYLQALVKLLAEQTKNPTLYHSLCNTQKIRLGYFSVGGDFRF